MYPCECKAISCCEGVEADGSQFSEFTFSLVSGQSITNAETVFTFPCPPGYNCVAGPITIIIPPGILEFKPVNGTPVTPGQPPFVGEDGQYFFQCNGATLVITVASGLGFSAAQLTQIINFLGSCVAEIEKLKVLPAPVPPNTPQGYRLNEAQYFTCGSDSSLMVFTGTFPSWITLDSATGGGRLVARAGVFSGGTQLSANTAAKNALDVFGNAALDDATLVCECFTTASPLPDATKDAAYSQTVVPSRGLTGVFSITSGTLPAGLTFDTISGEISGTPTVEENSSFTISYLKDGATMPCSKAFTLEVVGVVACADWTTLVWGPPNETTFGIGTTTVNAVQNKVTVLSCGSPGGDADTAIADITGSLTYNGPGCNCNLHIDMTANGNTNFVNGGVQISTVEGGVILVGTQFSTFGAVSIDQPFSLPDTGGLPFTVQVFAAGDSGEAGDSNTNGFGLYAEITNL